MDSKKIIKCAFLSTRTSVSSNIIDKIKELTPDVLWDIHESSIDLQNLEYHDYNFVFVFKWPYIISSDKLAQSTFIGFHTSNLPHGRGGSPIQNQILDGIEMSCVNAIQLVREVDAGPILDSRSISLQGSIDDIWRIIGLAVIEMIPRIIRGACIPKQQEYIHDLKSYKRRTDNKFGQTNNLHDAYRFIQMLDGEDYPHAYIEIGNYRIELTRASFKHNKIICDAQITLKDHKTDEHFSFSGTS